MKKITVGIDIRDLRLAKTGAKTYLEEICTVFAKEHKGFTFHFIDTWLPVYAGSNKLLKLVEHIRFICWKQLLLPLICWQKGCDVLFCTDYFLPLFSGKCKTLVVFHDAFFWEYPDHYNQKWIWLFRNIAVRAAKKAAFVVTPTAYTKERICFFSGIPPEKVIPVYEAPKKFPEKNTIPVLPASSLLQNLVTRDYILHTGTFEKRKNLPRLIEAFHQLRSQGYPNIRLLLAGQSSNKLFLDDTAAIEQMISEYHLEEVVVRPGYIPDSDLAACYRHALMYVFPSLNEGFGIPVLEAFSFGIPLIIAKNTCLPEVAGDAAIRIDPSDVNDIATKMKQLIESKELRESLATKGRERLQSFSWKKTGDSLMALFEKAVAKK